MVLFSNANRNSGRTSASSRRRRFGVRSVAIAAIGLLVSSGAVLAQRDGVADALAGHQAEMRQLATPDPMRRAYFFDPVDVEGPNPGVPCDHLASRRPEVAAGNGQVVLLESLQSPVRRLRYWLPPDLSQGQDSVAAAIRFAEEVAFGPFKVLGVRQFVWCR